MSGAEEDDNFWDVTTHCSVCASRNVLELSDGVIQFSCEYDGCERTFCDVCVPGNIFCCCDGLCTHSSFSWVVRRVHRKPQHAL